MVGLVQAARVTCAAMLLTLGVASSAFALDAFWQGRRDAVWHHGINPVGGQSNWYSAPPLQGAARDVPNDVAIFAEGAREYDIRIGRDARDRLPRIREMVFRPNNEKYTFDVRTLFTIKGGGIRNNDITPPLFTIAAMDQESSPGILFDDAVLQSDGEWPDAKFRIRQGGRLTFQGNSRGGDAEVVNFGGEVTFSGFSSAARMTITNRSQPTPFNNSRIFFSGHSTGGDAHLINQKHGQVDFGGTTGPGGNGAITVGKIDNRAGALNISATTIQVSDSFVQAADGTMFIHHDEGSKHGRLIVQNDAKLGGTLVTTGFFRSDLVGRHVILRAKGERKGRFDNEELNGGRLEYGPKTVTLVIGD